MAEYVSYNQNVNHGFGKKLKLLIILILALGAIVGLGFTFKYLINNNPTKIANNFVLDVKNNKAAAAYALTDSGFRSNTSLADWQTGVSGFAQDFQSIPSLARQNQSKDSADYYYNVKGQTQDHTLHLILSKEKGLWKVGEFQELPAIDL